MSEDTKEIMGDVELLSLSEAAKSLGLKSSTNLSKAIREKTLKGVRLGYCLYVTPEAVEEYRRDRRGRFYGRDPQKFCFNRIKLTNRDREMLSEMTNSGDEALARRAKAILLIAEGGRPHKFSEQLGLSHQAIYTWVKRFLEEGPEGLRGRRYGRPPKAEPILEKIPTGRSRPPIS